MLPLQLFFLLLFATGPWLGHLGTGLNAPQKSPQKPRLAPVWRYVLASPGGELPFEVSFEERQGQWLANLHNGDEVIPLGAAKLVGSTLTLQLAPYDSRLVAQIAPDGQSLTGHWSKSLGADRSAQLALHATAGKSPRFALKATSAEQRAQLDGRWAIKFASDDDLSIGHFTSYADGRAAGTFETTLGDYRYLAGAFDGERLRLSCFDGGHAFLFEARLTGDGQLIGDFWSRDSWHDTWLGRMDREAQLADPFGLSVWNEGASLRDLVFPDLERKPRSLADTAFDGRARILSLFGTWCPNCNDEARFLGELARRYGPRGLSIVGLAFELDDDFERSVRQVKRFQARHGVHYPILIAGVSNKTIASKAFPALDRVRAYPTAIFLDARNRVRAVHTGFSGPATGAAHEHMRERYEALLEEILSESEK